MWRIYAYISKDGSSTNCNIDVCTVSTHHRFELKSCKSGFGDVYILLTIKCLFMSHTQSPGYVITVFFQIYWFVRHK